MGRKTLNNQIQHTLTQKARIGESRHKAKEELKQVDKKTLKKCKKILQKTLVKLGN